MGTWSGHGDPSLFKLKFHHISEGSWESGKNSLLVTLGSPGVPGTHLQVPEVLCRTKCSREA